MADEILKLVQQVVGAEEVAALEKKHEDLLDQLKQSVVGLKGLDAQSIASDAKVKALGDSVVATAARLKKLKEETAAVGTGANSAAYKLQVFGQGLDDLQYVGEQGLRPIINNLMQISPAIGIGAIAINTMIPVVKRLFDSFETKKVDALKDTIAGLKKRVDELNDKKVRLEVEDEELEKAKEKVDALIRAKKELDDLLKSQDEGEKASGQAVEKAIIETKGGQEALAEAADRYAKDRQAKEQEKGRFKGIEDEIASKEQDKTNAGNMARFHIQAAAPGRVFTEEDLDQAAREATERIEKEIQALQAKLQIAKDKFKETALAEFNTEIVHKATKGQGLEQIRAQQRLQLQLGMQGGVGEQVAMQIGEHLPADEAARLKAKHEKEEAEKKAQEEKREDAPEKKAQREREQEAKRYASELFDELSGHAVKRGGLSREHVKEALKNVAGPGKADQLVDLVLPELNKKQQQRIGDRQNKLGPGATPEQALADLKKDELEKDDNEKRKDERKTPEQREAEKKKKDMTKEIADLKISGDAFGHMARIARMPHGADRVAANKQLDALIQQATAQGLIGNKDVTAEQANEITNQAPQILRQQFAEMIVKNQQLMIQRRKARTRPAKPKEARPDVVVEGGKGPVAGEVAEASAETDARDAARRREADEAIAKQNKPKPAGLDPAVLESRRIQDERARAAAEAAKATTAKPALPADPLPIAKPIAQMGAQVVKTVGAVTKNMDTVQKELAAVRDALKSLEDANGRIRANSAMSRGR